MEIFNENKNIKNGYIYGFTTEMSRFYELAEVIITKPGGLTITECMKKELPMIIPFYIPGQEEANRDFRLNNQLIFYPTKHYSLEAIILKIIENDNSLKIIKKNIKNNFINNSAANIAKMFL